MNAMEQKHDAIVDVMVFRTIPNERVDWDAVEAKETRARSGREWHQMACVRKQARLACRPRCLVQWINKITFNMSHVIAMPATASNDTHNGMKMTCEFVLVACCNMPVLSA